MRRTDVHINGIRRWPRREYASPPYNWHHTYATIRLMSGINPAYISQQLGHIVPMLLFTFARRINSSSNCSKLEKLNIGIKSVSANPKLP